LDAQGTATLSDANLTIASATTAHKNRKATFLIPSSGKWYWELTTASTCSASVILGWGLQTTSAATDSQAGNANTWMAQNDANQDIFNQTTNVLSTGSAVSGGAIRQVAYDADTGKLWFGINNTWYSSTDLTSGNPSAGTNQCMTLSAGNYFPTITCYNLTANANFGQRPFSYTPPTGFNALNTFNLPTPTIVNGANYMNATLWTGTNSTGARTITGLAFQPDLVWGKSRSSAFNHQLYDSVRGIGKSLISNSSAAEDTTNISGYISAFNSDGFTATPGSSDNWYWNYLNGTFVGWVWKAGGTSSSNTNGSITSTVSVNATAGFSVVTYTGTGANATVGHGLGVAPSMVIVKARNLPNSIARPWAVWHTALSATEVIFLNDTAAKSTGATTYWNSTLPTSSVFSLGNEPVVNGATGTVGIYVAYCFSAVKGYSAFGSYTGNGSSDGPFVFLGFRPRWVMVKNTSAVNQWNLWDTSRDTYNVMNDILVPNSSGAETNSYPIDILSNGFKIRGGAGLAMNDSSNVYIYAAFAENPFKLALAR
jgi:hypothetical protein